MAAPPGVNDTGTATDWPNTPGMLPAIVRTGPLAVSARLATREMTGSVPRTTNVTNAHRTATKPNTIAAQDDRVRMRSLRESCPEPYDIRGGYMGVRKNSQSVLQ